MIVESSLTKTRQMVANPEQPVKIIACPIFLAATACGMEGAHALIAESVTLELLLARASPAT